LFKSCLGFVSSDLFFFFFVAPGGWTVIYSRTKDVRKGTNNIRDIDTSKFE